MELSVLLATQNSRETSLLVCIVKGKFLTLVCFLLPLKRERKTVWYLQHIFSIWRPLAFLPVTLSKPRQHIKKQRHYFADKGPSSQSYGFPSSHVWKWPDMTWCLATWCEEPVHWKRPWCWEGLKAGGEGDNRGWDAWMDQLLNRHEFSKLWGLVMDRKARHAAVHGVPKSQTPWMTELTWSIWESLRGKWCWGTSWHRAVSLCYIPD